MLVWFLPLDEGIAWKSQAHHSCYLVQASYQRSVVRTAAITGGHFDYYGGDGGRFGQCTIPPSSPINMADICFYSRKAVHDIELTGHGFSFLP